jgi:Oxidoreductase-like protein, N-terminal
METLSKPTPPRKPEPHECCGTGCIPCVMDLYEEELWEYEKSMKAWNETHGRLLPPITDGPT